MALGAATENRRRLRRSLGAGDGARRHRRRIARGVRADAHDRVVPVRREPDGSRDRRGRRRRAAARRRARSARARAARREREPHDGAARRRLGIEADMTILADLPRDFRYAARSLAAHARIHGRRRRRARARHRRDVGDLQPRQRRVAEAAAVRRRGSARVAVGRSLLDRRAGAPRGDARQLRCAGASARNRSRKWRRSSPPA